MTPAPAAAAKNIKNAAGPDDENGELRRVVSDSNFAPGHEVLLLEQEPGSLKVVRQALPDVVMHSLPMTQVRRAPDFVSRHRINAVFCDLAGVDPATPGSHKQLQRVHPDLNMVMVVPDGDVDALAAAFREGASDVLTAPLEPTAVGLAWERLLVRFRSQQASNGISRVASHWLDELVLLKSISLTANETPDLEQLLSRVTELIQQALRVEIVSLMLVDQEGDLSIHAAAGLPPEVVDTVKVAYGNGIAGNVLASGEAILVEDMATDGRFAPCEIAGRYRTGSLLSVPVACRGETFGVLNVNNKESGETFLGSDLNILNAIAHQTALAIENFKLVDKIRQQNTELQNLYEDLVAFHHDRSRFVCSLSHELKTPLTTVLGFADLMVEQFGQLEPARLFEYIGKIHHEAMHLEQLLSGMLRLFSIDSGSEHWHWQMLDFGRCLSEACQRYEVAMAEKDVGLQLAISEDLLPVWGAPDKVGVLLDVLLDNAVSYNRCGGTICLAAQNLYEAGKDQVVLTLTSQGLTFPEDDIEAFLLRDPVDIGLNTETSGIVGVGLATCRAILLKMYGRVFFEKANGEETVLKILLPTRPFGTGESHE